MRQSEPTRVAAPDPWATVAAARAERGTIIATLLRAWHRRRRAAKSVRRAATGPRPGMLSLLPLAAGYVLSYMFRNVNGVLAPDIVRDLGIDAGTLGLMTSVTLLAFAAAQLPVGVLLDRYGPARVQVVLLLCAAAGSALGAVASSLPVLLLGRALIGVGTAGSLVAGLKAAATWFPPDRLARVNGVLVMCGGLGALAATWPVEFALRFMDWRGLTTVFAILALLCAGCVRAIVPNPSYIKVPAPRTVSLRDVTADPLFRRFAPLSATCFGTVLAVQGLWTGPWLADVDQLPRSDAAGVLAGMAAVLVVAAPCWGLLTERLRPRVKLTRLAAWAVVAMLGAEALLLARPGLPCLLPWCMFAAFGGITVLSFSVLSDHFPPEAIGRANSALNVLHMGVSFLIQLGFGQVVARWAAVDGHYPAEAYRAGLLLPMALQLAALAWFLCPRRAGAAATQGAGVFR